MSPVVQSLQLFLLAGVAFLSIGALASAGLVRLVRPRLLNWEPRTRHRAIVLLAALPVLTALALLVAVSLPSLLALGLPGLDHCTAHDDGHAHLCFTHLPVTHVHMGLSLGLALLLAYGVMRAARAGRRLARALLVVRSLARVGEEQSDRGFTIIDTTQPVCLTAGLLRPRVLISRSLLGALDSREQTVVLAHERAHVRRRDALTASVARALAVFHLPEVGRWLVSELEVAAEQVCDEEAATLTDRVTVAAAILKVERAVWHSTEAQSLGLASVAFGARAVERRVEALLAEPQHPTSLLALSSALALTFGALLVHADELHHTAEFLLSVVAH